MTIKGSCLCGAVTYEITRPLDLVGHCHCSICRKSHGAAFATWAILEPGQFKWTAGEDNLQQYESSPGRTRCFCRRCGSPLASTEAGRVAEVTLATIDGDPGARPQAHIFIGSKAPWHDVADALPQYAAWPPGMEPP